MDPEPFIPRAEPYNPHDDENIPTAEPAGPAPAPSAPPKPAPKPRSDQRSVPPSAPNAPSSASVPDYGAFAEEQRAAWEDNRRQWGTGPPPERHDHGPRRQRRSRNSRDRRRGRPPSSPPRLQGGGRSPSLCGCVFGLVRAVVKLPFFVAATAVTLPASIAGAVLLAASAPFVCCSAHAAGGYRCGRELLVLPCRAGTLLGEPFAPRGGLCDRLVARQHARNHDDALGRALRSHGLHGSCCGSCLACGR